MQSNSMGMIRSLSLLPLAVALTISFLPNPFSVQAQELPILEPTPLEPIPPEPDPLEPKKPTRPQSPDSNTWQPVNRVDPNREIAIQVVNQTDLAIEYALTTNEAAPRALEPGEQGTIGKVPIPAYMLINPAFSQAARFKFDIAVDDQNQVTVTIRRLDQLPLGTNPADVAAGDTTFNINATGAIYVY